MCEESIKSVVLELSSELNASVSEDMFECDVYFLHVGSQCWRVWCDELGVVRMSTPRGLKSAKDFLYEKRRKTRWDKPE
jgi:hypothetical protein